MCSERFYYKLGENIRNLRTTYGETQLDLANAIGAHSPATISNFENGTRLPQRGESRDLLISIAKHYRITEDSLLHGSFSGQPISVLSSDVKESIEKLLPIICTDKALKNNNFKKAFDLHIELFNLILKNNVSESRIEECIMLYQKASDEGVVEARANILWWISLLGINVNFTTVKHLSLLDRNKSIFDPKTAIKNILPDSHKDSYTIEDEKMLLRQKKDFNDEVAKDLLANIRLLKLSKKYSDLGDYYLAASYMFCIAPTSSSVTEETKIEMGAMLMSTLATMGNPYAKKIIDLPKLHNM